MISHAYQMQQMQDLLKPVSCLEAVQVCGVFAAGNLYDRSHGVA